MKIELIYEYDCPNVSAARERLAQACVQAGVRQKWLEWERSAPGSPDHVRRYGSPTILVNSQDVEGMKPSDGSASCRVYRGASGEFPAAPSVETIFEAVRSATEKRAAWRRTLAALPGVGAALLPIGVCSACWPAYAGLLGSVGLGFLFQETYLLSITAALLGLALFALGYRAAWRRGYTPFVFGLIGASLALGFKFFMNFPPAVYLGLALLVAVSLWNAWPIRPSVRDRPESNRGEGSSFPRIPS